MTRYRVRGFRPGAMASRPNLARTLSTALETSLSFAVSSGGREPSNNASCTAGGGVKVESATPTSRAGTRRARRSLTSNCLATTNSARSDCSGSSTVRLACRVVKSVSRSRTVTVRAVSDSLRAA